MGARAAASCEWCGCVCSDIPVLITHPEHCRCRKCKINVFDVERIKILVQEIPHRLWDQKKITTAQLEQLSDKLNCIVYVTFGVVGGVMLGERAFLRSLQKSILIQVGEVIQQRYGLRLTQQDENIFEDFNKEYNI